MWGGQRRRAGLSYDSEIKTGIAQDLTKPINGRDLLKEVDALAVKIEEKHKEQEIKEKYMREMQERGELFRYLVTGSRSIAELFDLASRLNIDLSSMWYNIVLLHVQSMNHEQNEYSGSIVEIEQEGKISCIAECNPLLGPRVRVAIDTVESGGVPNKYYYVNEEIFSANPNITSVTVDKKEYPVTIVAK